MEGLTERKMRKAVLTYLIIAITAIYTANAFSDDPIKTPTIIKGKIWGGSDTLDLGNQEIPDSIISSIGDTALIDAPGQEIDWSSEDVIQLPGKSISSKAVMLRLKLSLPRTLKFIDNAPVKLAAKSSDPEIIEIGEGAGNDPGKGFVFPLSVTPGKADLYLYYRVVCCTKGHDAACFFKEAKLRIPVAVGDYKDEILNIRHSIEN
jgi:hypothetical protein